MNATVTEIIGLGTALIILAGITYAIGHGGKTAQVFTAIGKSFTDALKVARGS